VRIPVVAIGVLVVALSSLGQGASQATPSKVKFLMVRCVEDHYNPGAYGRVVGGVVSPDIDLKNDDAINSLIADGAAFAMKECPSARIPFGQITVLLGAGDPSSLMQDEAETRFSWAFGTIGTPAVPSGFVYARSTFGWDEKSGLSSTVQWEKLVNGPKIALERRLAYEAVERARQSEQQARERAQEAEVAPIRALMAKYKVTAIVDVIELTANPFAYKGKIVAVTAAFQRMTSETKAVFDERGRWIVVSGVPTGRFTARDKNYSSFVVGKVLGASELKSPLGGADSYPHISYLGSGVCGQACYERVVRRR
jgi:hypothetical protein